MKGRRTHRSRPRISTEDTFYTRMVFLKWGGPGAEWNACLCWSPASSSAEISSNLMLWPHECTKPSSCRGAEPPGWRPEPLMWWTKGVAVHAGILTCCLTTIPTICDEYVLKGNHSVSRVDRKDSRRLSGGFLHIVCCGLTFMCDCGCCFHLQKARYFQHFLSVTSSLMTADGVDAADQRVDS